MAKYWFARVSWVVMLYLQDLSLTAGDPSRRHSGDIPDPTPGPRLCICIEQILQKKSFFRRKHVIPKTIPIDNNSTAQHTIAMAAQLELYVLSWGIYPRRVLLYLAEKGLLSSPLLKITPVTPAYTGMTAPGKPPGSVPILRLPDGSFIKQSLAIIEFFEDICDNPDPSKDWQVELSRSSNQKINMRGSTAEEKARTREILALVDEASTHFCFAGHKGTALFVPLEKTSALAAELALEFCKKTLRLVEENFARELCRSIDDGRVSIADCVFYSLLQFSEGVYGVDLLAKPELPILQRLRAMLQARGWVGLEEPHCPEQIRSLASEWLPVT